MTTRILFDDGACQDERRFISTADAIHPAAHESLESTPFMDEPDATSLMRMVHLLLLSLMMSLASGTVRFALPSSGPPWLDVVFLASTALAMSLAVIVLAGRFHRTIGRELDATAGDQHRGPG